MNLLRALLMATLLLVAGVIATIPAHGTTITNGTPAVGGGGLVMDTFEGAEYFDLPVTATIRSIEFANTQGPNGLGQLNYAIYANVPNPFPGALIASGVNVPYTQTFIFNGGTQSVSTLKDDFNLLTPIILTPGRYWVGLNFPNGGFPVWDATTTPNAQLSAGFPISSNPPNWNLDAVQLYLGVTFDPVPEPGSVVLVLGGMAGLVWRRRRRIDTGGFLNALFVSRRNLHHRASQGAQRLERVLR